METRGISRFYQLISVTKSDPSGHADGQPWYKYIIRCEGATTIAGERQGTQSEVTEHANDFIEKLNNRDLFPRSYAPRGRPKRQ